MFKGFVLWSGVVTGGLTLIQNLVLLKNGKMDKRELGVSTTKNVTETVGSVVGMEYGAMAGSAVLPGVGTIIGGVLGYVVGSRVGQTVGNGASNLLFPGVDNHKGLEYKESLLLQSQPQT